MFSRKGIAPMYVAILMVLAQNVFTASLSVDRLERIVKAGFEMEKWARETDVERLLGTITDLEKSMNDSFNKLGVVSNGERDIGLEYINKSLSSLDAKMKYLSNGVQREKASLLKVKRSVSDLTAMFQQCVSGQQTAAVVSEHTEGQKQPHVARLVTSLKDTLASVQRSIEDKMASMEQSILTELKTAVKPSGAAPQPTSCLDILMAGQTKSGVYWIQPGARRTPVRVYCDQDTDGGGWTVFQRRTNGSVNFYRTWSDYKSGFGDVEGEFWLGNDLIREMTSICCTELRVELRDFNATSTYAAFKNFSIAPESEHYALSIDGYSGTAGDSLRQHRGSKFSTLDRDNDNDDEHHTSCARAFKGAWWFASCHDSNLNGEYFTLGQKMQRGRGILWVSWHGTDYSLPYSEMKLR